MELELILKQVGSAQVHHDTREFEEWIESHARVVIHFLLHVLRWSAEHGGLVCVKNLCVRTRGFGVFWRLGEGGREGENGEGLW